MSLIRTWSGLDFNLVNPRPEMVEIRDIAVALSRIPRFNGATSLPYYVAQHSVLVAKIAGRLGATPEEQFIALLHDAHEAYVGDITRPVRVALNDAADYLGQRITRIDRAIFERFNLRFNGLPEVVRRADDIAFATEWRDLMPGRYAGLAEADSAPVKPKRSEIAEHDFLKAFEKLGLLAGNVVAVPETPAPFGALTR